MANCGTTGNIIRQDTEGGTPSKFMFDATSTDSFSPLYSLSIDSLFNIRIHNIPDGVQLRIKTVLLQSYLERSGGCGCVLPRQSFSSEIISERYIECPEASIDTCQFNVWLRGQGWYQFELWMGDELFENNGEVLIGVGYETVTPTTCGIPVIHI